MKESPLSVLRVNARAAWGESFSKSGSEVGHDFDRSQGPYSRGTPLCSVSFLLRPTHRTAYTCTPLRSSGTWYANCRTYCLDFSTGWPRKAGYQWREDIARGTLAVDFPLTKISIDSATPRSALSSMRSLVGTESRISASEFQLVIV